MAASCEWHPQAVATAEKEPVAIDRRFSTGELPVAPQRYRLIWGRFCPWATQSAIAIDLQGLDQVISKGAIYPYRRGSLATDWVFGATDEVVDPVLQVPRLSAAYKVASPDFDGRATVPALVDTTTGAVVNNDANSLLNELTTQWEAYRTGLDLVPHGQETELAKLDAELLERVNQAPGKILEATSQEEYERLARHFFETLQKLDVRLIAQPYLLGERLTQADIRLFVTLVRFDLVYSQQNKLNYRRLQDYPHLWAYAKRLYRIPAFRTNTDFDAIFAHFYQGSDRPVTTFDRVIPFNDRAAAWNEA